MVTCHKALRGIKRNKIYHCYNLIINTQMSIATKEKKMTHYSCRQQTSVHHMSFHASKAEYMEWLLNSSVTLCTERHMTKNQQKSRASPHSFICGWCCQEVQYPYTCHTDHTELKFQPITSVPHLCCWILSRKVILEVITLNTGVRLLQDTIT